MPQFTASVPVLTHAVPHKVRPGGQVQLLPTQFRPPPQATPQPPQLFGSVRVSVQAVPHGVCPPAHVLLWQAPLRQASVLEQARPHRPQWALELCGSTQVPSHSVWPCGQAQTPERHSWPPAQTTPTQAASAQLPWKQTESGSQLCDGQSLGRHAPAAHRVVDVQALPHRPQLASSSLGFTHNELHTVAPGAQPQRPLWHWRLCGHDTPTHARSVHWAR
jgi:hypothetical protein